MAASDENGVQWRTPTQPKGISSTDFLDFILGLPERALIVGYAFLYDLTMGLRDLPDRSLYLLYHEEKRARLVKGRIIYHPIRWDPPSGGQEYWINFTNRRLTVKRGHKFKSTGSGHCKFCKKRQGAHLPTRHATVWDIFRFFRGRFTEAIKEWKVAPPEQIAIIERMKDKRHEFNKLEHTEVEDYCLRECLYLAKLMRALVEAHKDADLELKHYYGAGSTASVFLDRMEIRKKRGHIPESMRLAVASAFFGGRFENSIVGPVRQKVYSYDISSAYPYQTTFQPCLECGTWEHFKGNGIERQIEIGNLALVHWTIPRGSHREGSAWGPLPVRARQGTIAFPLSARGGWCWQNEYKQARKLANVEAQEAWIYRTDCDHAPFSEIPKFYLERVRLGKDARGIPLKLGINSVYGKLAQSKGLKPPYQSWVWAGNITSGTRAQLLEAILLAENPWDVLMFATDGVQSRCPLHFPAPRDTGTFGVDKPLGGWEAKELDRGVFAVRPGIYFPLEPTDDDIKEVRARGLGKKVLYSRWSEIADCWEDPKKRHEGLEVKGQIRFVGAKSAIYQTPSGEVKRSDNYGEWVPYDIRVTFHPAPKRWKVLDDNRMVPFTYFDWESVPYDAAMTSPEMAMMNLASMIAEEQPDVSFGDME
jgi:hypothetical protein